MTRYGNERVEHLDDALRETPPLTWRQLSPFDISAKVVDEKSLCKTNRNNLFWPDNNS